MLLDKMGDKVAKICIENINDDDVFALLINNLFN
jgi:hypothetical protein